jgi:hypothetical protein
VTRLWAQDRKISFRFRNRGRKDLRLLNGVQTGYRAHRDSYPTGVLSQENGGLCVKLFAYHHLLRLFKRSKAIRLLTHGLASQLIKQINITLTLLANIYYDCSFQIASSLSKIHKQNVFLYFIGYWVILIPRFVNSCLSSFICTYV